MKKYVCTKVIIVLFILISTCGICTSQDLGIYHGVRTFYGESSWTAIGPDPSDGYYWSNISYVLGKDINSWCSFEGLMGPGYIESDDFGDSISVEMRLLFDLHYKFLYLKVGGGAAHLFDSDNIPDLADSNLYGIISYSTGIRFLFNENSKNPCEFTLGYGVEHLSSPFHHADEGDSGMNVGVVKIGLDWKF